MVVIHRDDDEITVCVLANKICQRIRYIYILIYIYIYIYKYVLFIYVVTGICVVFFYSGCDTWKRRRDNSVYKYNGRIFVMSVI
jgi:hypothetical protein